MQLALTRGGAARAGLRHHAKVDPLQRSTPSGSRQASRLRGNWRATARMAFRRTGQTRRGVPNTAALSSGVEGLSPKGEFSPAFATSCVFASALGALCFGLNLSVINGPLEAIAGAGNLQAQGLIVSVLLVGATLGSILAGKAVDSIGRKSSLLLTGAFLLAGPLICVLGSGSLGPVVLGRGVVGVGVGLASSVVPQYIAEISPKHLRGTLGSVNQLTICFGILLGNVLNVLLSAHRWKFMFTLCALPPAGLVILALGFLPETPNFLVATGMVDKAEETARLLWGDSEQVAEAVAAAAEHSGDGGITPMTEIFSAKHRKMLTICCMLFVFQQMSGINAIVFFSSILFGQAGFQNPALASLTIGAVNLFGTLGTCFLVERMGRKSLLGTSFSVMAVALLGMALGGGQSSVILGAMMVYTLGFALGAGAIPGIYVQEIGGELRSQASSVAFTVHWLLNIAIGQAFLPLANALGMRAMFVCFSAVCCCALVFIHKFCVETKGKTFEEIKSLL